MGALACLFRSTALALVRHAMNKGHLQDISFMITKLRQLLGDCTFLEAFERTGESLRTYPPGQRPGPGCCSKERCGASSDALRVCSLPQGASST